MINSAAPGMFGPTLDSAASRAMVGRFRGVARQAAVCQVATGVLYFQETKVARW